MKWKRVLSAILTVMVLICAMSCGKKQDKQNASGVDPETAPHITLALRAGIYSDVIKSCLVQFEEENQVICDVLELGEEELHNGIIENASKAEGAYDLCMIDGSWKAELAANTALLNLSKEGYELDDDIIKATTAICYDENDVYVAPYYGNVTVLLFNKNLVEKAGYTVDRLSSLEEIYEVCKASQDRGNLGFMYRGDSPNNYVVDFLPILRSYGGWVVDENNNPTVDTAEFREALAFYKKLIATGKSESRDDLIMAIDNGAATMAVGWPGWYTPTKRSASDYIALTGKAFSDSEGYNANVYGIWTIGVPVNSQNKELAVKLVKYLMDPEVQKRTIEYGGVPCRYSSLTDEKVLADNPPLKAVCAALENGVYRPDMEEWTDFYTILGNKMELIINGEKDIDEGLSEAQAELEEMLRK
ncbi:extracellular solute-binding protein [Butyrivibrio sp. INlla16]|uniref:extracellular solute-binding protein n=1 Tax=Butyrivibrio sp. INlla16 TaxID=1520807 RepID=UPI00088E1E48|nr:extracellular solute-binding protein [Butyrivibrio sp. INlla16]SDB59570.1 ABC-type glycerol-3-phosphate transport system, substrate-binding protein [Butyrivibrio sp. INlla16]